MRTLDEGRLAGMPGPPLAAGRSPLNQPKAALEAPPSTADQFAWMRTVMGLQRTLMAAARTATALIAFGFTVTQFFERLQEITPEGSRFATPAAARNFGLLLIGAGVVTMMIFTWQFRRTAHLLLSGKFHPARADSAPALFTASYTVAFAITLAGAAAFLSVLFHF
jgi:putative membrane protein